VTRGLRRFGPADFQLGHQNLRARSLGSDVGEDPVVAAGWKGEAQAEVAAVLRGMLVGEVREVPPHRDEVHRLFRWSAMIRLPSRSLTASAGPNRRGDSGSCWQPLTASPVPAMVVIVPEGSIRRTRWLFVSAM
jgi:hypothetical protein